MILSSTLLTSQWYVIAKFRQFSSLPTCQANALLCLGSLVGRQDPSLQGDTTKLG